MSTYWSISWWINKVLTNIDIQSGMGVFYWLWPVRQHRLCSTSNVFDLRIPGGRYTDTYTQTHTHTHTYSETDSEGERKVNRSPLSFTISFCACSFRLSTPPTVFHNVLDPSAGHSEDTSKSLLLAKCQRMKWQQTQAPWNKYRNVCRRWEEQSRKDKVRNMQIYNMEDQSKMEEEEEEVKNMPSMAIDR